MDKFSLALITGASSGIGEGLARRLAKQQVSLILSGRNLDRLEKIKAELSSHVEVALVQGDLASHEDQEALAAVIEQRAPDLVINNAGSGLYGEVIGHPVEDQMAMIDLNIRALTRLSIAAGKTMKEKGKQGVIMNISSVAAYQPFPSFSVYAATKSFVNSFSIGFDAEMAQYGIRVLTACPGQVLTRFKERASKGSNKNEASWLDMTTDYAVSQILDQIAKKERVRVFSPVYGLMVLLTRILPYRFLLPILKKRIEGRLKNQG